MTYKWVDTVRYKELLIFDKLIKVDTEIKYVAVDGDGTVMGYIGLPSHSKYPSSEYIWEDPNCGPMTYLGRMVMTDLDWTTMMVEV